MKKTLFTLFILFNSFLFSQSPITRTLGEFKEIKVYDLINVDLIKSSENRITISGKHAVNFLQGMIGLNTTVLAVALYSSATTKAQAPIPVVVLFVVFLVLLFLSMRTERAQA